MRSAVGAAATESVVTLVDEFHVTDRALLRARDRVRKSADSAAMIEFRRQARRYFETVEREAAAHIAHLDHTLDELYQRQYNAQAERSVANRRLERTRAVLSALAVSAPEQTGP
jgi:phosphate uptake regulator